MAKTRDYNEYLIDRLKTPARAAAYLNAALEEYEPKIFLKALRKVATAQSSIQNVAAKSGMTRKGTYKALSEEGNPRLTTVLGILSALKLGINIQPKVAVKK